MTNAYERLDAKLQAMRDGTLTTPREHLLKVAQDESAPKDLRDQAADLARRYLPEVRPPE
jgi:hypothetical protein